VADQRRGRHAGCPPTRDEEVFESLRAWRRERAQENGAPAFTVFTDATLEAIAERDPLDAQNLLAVPGVGPAKVERYGEDVLEILARHRQA
jgi:DNA helicase-2/ATP-dependent DNA helicase PcrA